ncbi:hypothetical protein DAMNIGENAA_19940 [Desulforhabdus amnigena]|uniref:Uncharacterized protein n=1 Tax=Desulforhabdus amnigena TaxID=40218 RepID=A0A9W6CZB8_9BACT|nr:hypothetical protein DAMNIGENAA_19940 [Desulforhabdus amnigena]
MPLVRTKNAIAINIPKTMLSQIGEINCLFSIINNPISNTVIVENSKNGISDSTLSKNSSKNGFRENMHTKHKTQKDE